MRGRLLETVLKAEQGAVPAAVARNHALGRPRDSARRALRPACEELAGLDRRVAGQVRAAGSINPQVERREAGASIARRALCLAGTVPDIAPPGAPLPLACLRMGDMAKLERIALREQFIMSGDSRCHVPLLSYLALHCCHAPRKRGIQYSVRSRQASEYGVVRLRLSRTMTTGGIVLGRTPLLSSRGVNMKDIDV